MVGEHAGSAELTPVVDALDYDERHARGVDLYRTVGGTDQPDAMARFMVNRYGPLGSCATDLVLGDCWSRPQLSRRDRSLIVVALLIAQGATEELALHAQAALRHGCRRDEIDELTLTVAAYCGFPMAMDGARVLEAVWMQLDGVERLPKREGLEPRDDVERRETAAAVWATMTDETVDPEALLAEQVELAGGVGAMAVHWVLGELWPRTQLHPRDRSLVVLALLGLTQVLDELHQHVAVALHHGLDPEEIEEVMVQLSLYGGVPRATSAMRRVRAALAATVTPTPDGAGA